MCSQRLSQEGDLPDVQGLVQVMAALCQDSSSRCLVAFECREAALRTQLLAAARQHFAQVLVALLLKRRSRTAADTQQACRWSRLPFPACRTQRCAQWTG